MFIPASCLLETHYYNISSSIPSLDTYSRRIVGTFFHIFGSHRVDWLFSPQRFHALSVESQGYDVVGRWWFTFLNGLILVMRVHCCFVKIVTRRDILLQSLDRIWTLSRCLMPTHAHELNVSWWRFLNGTVTTELCISGRSPLRTRSMTCVLNLYFPKCVRN